MDFKQLENDARTQPDIELLRRTATLIPQSEIHMAAKMELARRERFRSFWRKDIVAWAALVLSVLSLTLSLYGHKP